MKTQNVKMIALDEWDNLVEQTYGRPYAFQQQDGCKDRGVYHLTVPSKYPEDFDRDIVPEIVNHNKKGVSFKAWLARDPKQSLPEQEFGFQLLLWWQRNFYPNIEMIANDLLARGLIESGDYCIEIDW